MAIDPDLLEILRCPETRQPLHLADQDVIDSLNERIARGELTNKGGDKVDEPIDAGLVREDGRVLYPIRDEIPEMLIDAGVELESTSGEA